MLKSLEPLGIRQAVLTSQDGLVIESAGSSSPDPDLLAAELATLVRTSQTLTKTLGGSLRRFSLATENREVLAVVFGRYCLGAVVDKGADRKGVGNELSRLALRLGKTL
mgnify:FL=1